MDYQNRAGSKKGAGGIASDSQANLQRRKQVDELLRQGVEVPYTFEEETNHESEENNDKQTKQDPYIYKNHSGKLVCKLCNTLHMSWSSVERHLSGKKHGLNVLRRSKMNDDRMKNGTGAEIDTTQTQFEQEVAQERDNIKHNGVVANCQIVNIRDETSDLEGICIRVDYNDKANDTKVTESDYPPFARIVLGLELADDAEKDKKYIVVANEPFENVAIEIPNKEIVFGNDDFMQENAIDKFNGKCTYWDKELGYFFIQFFFKELASNEGLESA